MSRAALFALGLLLPGCKAELSHITPIAVTVSENGIDLDLAFAAAKDGRSSTAAPPAAGTVMVLVEDMVPDTSKRAVCSGSAPVSSGVREYRLALHVPAVCGRQDPSYDRIVTITWRDGDRSLTARHTLSATNPKVEVDAGRATKDANEPRWVTGFDKAFLKIPDPGSSTTDRVCDDQVIAKKGSEAVKKAMEQIISFDDLAKVVDGPGGKAWCEGLLQPPKPSLERIDSVALVFRGDVCQLGGIDRDKSFVPAFVRGIVAVVLLDDGTVPCWVHVSATNSARMKAGKPPTDDEARTELRASLARETRLALPKISKTLVAKP